MGELEVRGPWVARAYHRGQGEEKFTDDGWFQTGDVVKIDERGNLRICDRSKDLVKSGGEWISSVDLENLLMAHPAVAEAAVIAIPDERWGERPLAVGGPARGARGRRPTSCASTCPGLRQVAAARPLRVHRRDPAHGHRQVQEDRPARAVRREPRSEPRVRLAARLSRRSRVPHTGAGGCGQSNTEVNPCVRLSTPRWRWRPPARAGRGRGRITAPRRRARRASSVRGARRHHDESPATPPSAGPGSGGAARPGRPARAPGPSGRSLPDAATRRRAAVLGTVHPQGRSTDADRRAAEGV